MRKLVNAKRCLGKCKLIIVRCEITEFEYAASLFAHSNFSYVCNCRCTILFFVFPSFSVSAHRKYFTACENRRFCHATIEMNYRMSIEKFNFVRENSHILHKNDIFVRAWAVIHHGSIETFSMS